MATPTATQTTRSSIPRLAGVDPLPASLLALASAPIQAASEAFDKALADHREAHRALIAARDAVENAPAADRRAAADALETDADVPEPSEPEARATLAAAELQAPAAELVARRRQGEFLAALREDREKLLSATESALEEIGAPMLKLVDEIEAALIQRRDLHRLAGELATGDYLAGRHPQFRVAAPKPGRDPLIGETRELLERLRRTLSEVS